MAETTVTTTQFIDSEGLLFVCQLIANKLTGYVKSVDGKGLSTNDFTDGLKEQLMTAYNSNHTHENRTVLDSITAALVEAWNNAEANAINSVKVNGTAAEIDSADKSVNITVPTKVSDVTNDSGYQTAEQVETTASTLIAAALAGITGIKFEVVDTLPDTGADGTIYLIAADGDEPNVYNEYVWVGDKFEQLGTTKATFSQYWSKEELTIASNEDIAAIFDTAFTA